jgi:MSHA biogenesis protein MshJ
MKAALQTFWQRRSRRERWVAGIAAAVLLAPAIDAAIFAGARRQAAALHGQLASGKRELSQLQILVARHAQAGDAPLQERLAVLAQRREQAEATIRAAQADLVSPREMPAQLARLLERHPRVRVVAASSTPPIPVATPGGAASDGAVNGLYQHGMEIQVEARYLDLLDWLDALEKSPRRMYWRELELKMNPQGVPVTRIAFFTLSQEAAWLRL